MLCLLFQSVYVANPDVVHVVTTDVRYEPRCCACCYYRCTLRTTMLLHSIYVINHDVILVVTDDVRDELRRCICRYRRCT